MTTFRALYPSAYESVALARRAVEVFAERCGFPRSGVCDIVLAAGEACNNAVEHGHVERGRFTVSCTYDRGVLCVEVLDDGGGFDIESAGAPSDPTAYFGRGRGIPIMRALMDRVAFRKTSIGTAVTLLKNNQPAASANLLANSRAPRLATAASRDN